MNKKLIIGIIAFLAYNTVSATKIKVVNNADYAISVNGKWAKRSEKRGFYLKPGESKTFDSFTHNFESIRWLDPKNNKFYKVTIKRTGGAVGTRTFDILDNGKYMYSKEVDKFGPAKVESTRVRHK